MVTHYPHTRDLMMKHVYHGGKVHEIFYNKYTHMPMIVYGSMRNRMSGAGWLDDLKTVGSKAVNYGKNIYSKGKEIYDQARPYYDKGKELYDLYEKTFKEMKGKGSRRGRGVDYFSKSSHGRGVDYFSGDGYSRDDLSREIRRSLRM